MPYFIDQINTGECFVSDQRTNAALSRLQAIWKSYSKLVGTDCK